MNRKSEVLALFLVACAVEGSVHAAEWYVRGGETGSGTLSSPFGTLQQAIDRASSGDSILVCEGRYVENLTIRSKAVAILGGWDAQFTERDSAIHASVISPANGAREVVYYSFSSGGELSGFTITGGGAGGVLCEYSSPVIRKNKVVATCSDFSPHSAVACSAGVIADNLIASNQARRGISVGDVIVIGNTITGNTGGGIGCGGSSTISGNIIAANTSPAPGGGIQTSSSSATIVNNLIVGNTSGWEGGGISVTSTPGSPRIISNTIVGNTAEGGSFGGGVYGHGGYTYLGVPPTTVTNCIIWGNTPDQVSGPVGGRPKLSYCCVQGGLSGYWNLGPGNVSADPLFADHDNSDYRLKSAEGRWSPSANGGTGGWVMDDVTSPCINAGDPSSDWSKEPFPHGRRVNIGAYGNTPEASKGKWILLGDADGDSAVTVLDLIVIRNLLGSGSPTGDNWWADVNEDGRINVLDLIFVRNWLGTKRE